MPERSSYAPGTPNWIDIGTDVDAAAAFYTGLFGWTLVSAGPDAGGYGFFTNQAGKLIAGVGPQQSPGPPFWSHYVSVADVDETTAKVEAAGGTVVVPPMDVMDQGRMAMSSDPTGAAVGLWQAAAHQGADVFNVPGSMTWNELQTRDIDAALPFYEKVFGWEWVDGPDSGYYVANIPAKQSEDKSNAGAMTTPPGVPDEAPNLWMVYFAGEDCDTSMAAAHGLVGELFLPAMQMVTGPLGGLIDPAGVSLLLGSF